MVPNGVYTIQVTPPYGYAADPVSRMVTVSGADMPDQNFTLTAIPSYTISGIISLDGNGLANVYVSATGTMSGGSAMTGADGRYQITAFEDEYVVTPDLFGYSFSPVTRTVSLHADASGVDFTATVVHMYNVSGTLTFNGNGLEGYWLSLSDAEGMNVGTTSAPTDSSGNFNFENVRDGAYTIIGTSCEYSFTPLPVTVSGADVTGLHVIAAALPAYSVSGTVTSSGVGVGEITMQLRKSDGSGADSMTQGDGTYLFNQCLSSGTYSLTPLSLWGIPYSFSPPSAEVTLTESNPSVTQNFTATPL
jgi:hypothetical protein